MGIYSEWPERRWGGAWEVSVRGEICICRPIMEGRRVEF